MRYSVESRDRIYVKGYGFLSFAKDFGAYATKVAKKISNKYSQNLLQSAKTSITDETKTASKIAIQKIEEETGDLLSDKIADETTNISKSPKQFHSKELYSKEL